MGRGPHGTQFITLQEDAALSRGMLPSAAPSQPSTRWKTSLWGPTSSKDCLSLSDPTVSMLGEEEQGESEFELWWEREPDPSSERGAPQKPKVNQKAFSAAFPFLYFISTARPLRVRGHVFISCLSLFRLSEF